MATQKHPRRDTLSHLATPNSGPPKHDSRRHTEPFCQLPKSGTHPRLHRVLQIGAGCRRFIAWRWAALRKPQGEVRGFSSRINDPKITPSLHRPGCLDSSRNFPRAEACRNFNSVAPQEKSFRAATPADASSCNSCSEWPPDSAPLEASSFPQRNDKSASAKNFLQLQESSRLARPHKAACVAG